MSLSHYKIHVTTMSLSHYKIHVTTMSLSHYKIHVTTMSLSHYKIHVTTMSTMSLTPILNANDSTYILYVFLIKMRNIRGSVLRTYKCFLKKFVVFFV